MTGVKAPLRNRTIKACSQRVKANPKAKNIKEPATEIEEKISKIKENFRFSFSLSLGVNGPLHVLYITWEGLSA